MNPVPQDGQEPSSALSLILWVQKEEAEMWSEGTPKASNTALREFFIIVVECWCTLIAAFNGNKSAYMV